MNAGETRFLICAELISVQPVFPITETIVITMYEQYRDDTPVQS